MQHSHARNWILALITTTAVASLTLAVPPTATAAPAEGAVIATGPVLAPEPPDATVVGVDANLVAGLTITGHGGKPVTVTTAGEATRTVTAKPNSPVIVRKLTPGKAYAVAIAGRRIATATPLAQVTPAGSLTVRAGSEPGSVDLSWAHRARPAHGQVTFVITATAQNLSARSTATIAPISTESRSATATLSGLDPQTLYRFDVVARNSASSSMPTSAVMPRSLADLTAPQASATDPVTKPAPAPEPAVTHTAASNSGGSATPNTRTIWVCPDGYSDTGGTCEKTLAYTFHDVTTTSPYTYHSETEQVWGVTGWGCWKTGALDADGGQREDQCGNTYGYLPVQVTVKDTPPAGFSDDGSQYTKTEPVKDSTPAGYSDNGSEWVATTNKTARVVPA